MNTCKVRHGDRPRHLLRLFSGPTESWSSVEPEVRIKPTTYPLTGGTSPHTTAFTSTDSSASCRSGRPAEHGRRGDDLGVLGEVGSGRARYGTQNETQGRCDEAAATGRRPVKTGGHRAREATASALLSQLLLATRSRDDRPARSCPGRPGDVADLLGRLHGLVHDGVEVRQLDTD